MRAILALLLFPLLVLADAPKTLQPPKLPEIRLPALGVTSSVGPASPAKLSPDLFYVIDSDVEILPLPSPEGHVALSKETGPLKLRGRFADGGGKIETRTYAGKYIYTVDAVSAGKCELLIVPVGAVDEAKVIRRSLLVEMGDGARPPPDPIDNDPKPFVGSWRILIIEETAEAAANRGQFFSDKALLSYIKSHCKSKPRWVEQDVVAANNKPPTDLAPWLAKAKGKRLPQLFLTGDDGTVLFEGNLPATPTEFLDLLKKVGGP